MNFQLILSFLLYPIYVCLSLSLVIICLFLNPIVVLFADDAGNLPRWLKWFQTFDDDLDAGTRNGNTAYKSRYMNRLAWLFRNSGYGFDYYPFGKVFNSAEWRIIKFVDTPERVVFFAVGNGFNYYYHGPLGMYKFGWKAWNYKTVDGWRTTPWGPEWRVPLVFSPNPFKTRTVV